MYGRGCHFVKSTRRGDTASMVWQVISWESCGRGISGERIEGKARRRQSKARKWYCSSGFKC